MQAHVSTWEDQAWKKTSSLIRSLLSAVLHVVLDPLTPQASSSHPGQCRYLRLYNALLSGRRCVLHNFWRIHVLPSWDNISLDPNCHHVRCVFPQVMERFSTISDYSELLEMYFLINIFQIIKQWPLPCCLIARVLQYFTYHQDSTCSLKVFLKMPGKTPLLKS